MLKNFAAPIGIILNCLASRYVFGTSPQLSGKCEVCKYGKC